jgi:hypothetical protein
MSVYILYKFCIDIVDIMDYNSQVEIKIGQSDEG